MLQIFRDGFLRDLLVLLVITTLLGSGVAAGLAYAIDTYFGDTVAGLIGESGQYDFILHVRQEAQAAAEEELKRILAKSFPGAQYQTGLTIAGTANFFITLPRKFQTQAVFERLGTYFGELPGAAGYTIMLEPSLLIRGVPRNLAGRLLTEISELAGVRFAFRDGSDLNVILTGVEMSAQVTRALEKIINRYQIININLPGEYKLDPLLVGDELVASLKEQMQPRLVENISQPSPNGDQAALLDTLREMRRFLANYATKVELLAPEGKLRPGHQVVLQGRAPTVPIVGERLDEANVIIEITQVRGEAAQGLIIQGDITHIIPANYKPRAQTTTSEIPPEAREHFLAYKVTGQREVGELVGEVKLKSERLALSSALEESALLLERLQKLARDGRKASDTSLATLAQYEKTVGQIRKVNENLERLEAILASPLGRLEDTRVQRLLSSLNTTATSIEALVKMGKNSSDLKEFNEGLNTFAGQLEGLVAQIPTNSPIYPHLLGLQTALTLLRGQDTVQTKAATEIQDGLEPLLPALVNWQERTSRLALELERGQVEPESKSRAVLREMQRTTAGILSTLALVDTATLRQGLVALRARLQSIEAVDLQGIAAQAVSVNANLPALKDEQIGRSLRLIDKYLAGEVIPSNEINLLVNNGLDGDRIKNIVHTQLGSKEVAVFTMQAGMVQPNMRSELLRILGEVRVTITAILVIVITVLTLLLDHTTLIALMRSLGRRHNTKPATSPAEAIATWPGGYLIYGAAVGGFLFGTMFTLSGARLPLIPLPVIILCGAGIGVVFALLADKFSPVRQDEVMAGEALGLCYAQILREIIIPAARPGLAQYLNQRRRFFAGTPPQPGKPSWWRFFVKLGMKGNKNG